MDDSNGLIYGLELQARALTPLYGEANDVCFLIATNSLKPNNQIHLLKFNEEKLRIEAEIFEHTLGEVWKIRSCPLDSRLIATCYNTQKGPQVQSQAALLTLPTEKQPIDGKSEFHAWDQVEVLKTQEFGENVKSIEFHPSQPNVLACIIDGNIVIYDRSQSQTRMVTEINPGSSAKTQPSIFGGKWSHHQQGNQFLALNDCNICSYDVRDTQHCAWKIEKAHGQLVRDLDCNPNKQCHIVTGGDDGFIKIWDYRMAKQPVFSRNDHAHWVWCVRFNTFHDQLILSSSSDCKVMLTSASSVSSEAVIDKSTYDANDQSGAMYDERSLNTLIESHQKVIPDGLLQTFDQHEDSVYCVEWSNVDPWTFASLSYDGRVLITKVPKHFKYQIIF